MVSDRDEGASAIAVRAEVAGKGIVVADDGSRRDEGFEEAAGRLGRDVSEDEEVGTAEFVEGLRLDAQDDGFY